jgi:hypothetical protein
MTTDLHRRGLIGGGLAALSGPALARPALALSFSRPMLADVLTLRSEPRFAGAISSLRLRGMEYVDAADHGRLFQSAIHFDSLGECLNPTQGGASSDGRQGSSRLLASEVTSDVFAVTTRMAYWLRPGQSCTLPEVGTSRARNRTRLSDVTLDVAHRFAVLAAANAVLADVRYTTATAHFSAVVEALTVYTPPALERLYVFNAAGGLAPTEPAAEQPRPYVLATADGAHAIALFSPTGAQPALFGGFSYGVVGKLNAVFRPDGPYPAGPHEYRLAWAVGTLDEVRRAVVACA